MTPRCVLYYLPRLADILDPNPPPLFETTVEIRGETVRRRLVGKDRLLAEDLGREAGEVLRLAHDGSLAPLLIVQVPSSVFC